MSECRLVTGFDPTKVKCEDCDWTGEAGDLDAISDIEERLSPGEIVPAGQCPECGTLCHLSEWPDWSAMGQLEAEKKRQVSLWRLADDYDAYGERAGHFVLVTPDGEHEIAGRGPYSTFEGAVEGALEGGFALVKLEIAAEPKACRTSRLPALNSIIVAGEHGIDRYPHARIEPGQRLMVAEAYEDHIAALVLGDDAAAQAQRAALAEWNGCIVWDVDAIPEGSGGLAPWFWSEVKDAEEAMPVEQPRAAA